MLREDNVRTGFFEPEQFEAVADRLPEAIRPAARFAYLTGWRKGEVLGLQWRQIDFNAGEVRLDPGTTKNREGRIFPFTPELKKLFEERRAVNKALAAKGVLTPWVFVRAGGRPLGSIRKAWATACKRVGLPGRLFHDLRRTAVRNMVRRGIPERVAMQLTGHKTRSVFERYNICQRRRPPRSGEAPREQLHLRLQP